MTITLDWADAVARSMGDEYDAGFAAIAAALRKAKAQGLRDAADCCDALLKYPKAVSATKRKLANELAAEFRLRADFIERSKA